MYSAVSVVTLSSKACAFEDSSVLSCSSKKSEQNRARAPLYSNYHKLSMTDSKCQGINQENENSPVSNRKKMKICLISMIVERLITYRFNNIFIQNPA